MACLLAAMLPFLPHPGLSPWAATVGSIAGPQTCLARGKADEKCRQGGFGGADPEGPRLASALPGTADASCHDRMTIRCGRHGILGMGFAEISATWAWGWLSSACPLV